MPLCGLELSGKILNIFAAKGLVTVRDLTGIRKSRLMDIPRIGVKAILAIERELAILGLELCE
jgi:hypothetical protein